MECGVYESFTIAVVAIAVAMVIFALIFNPKLMKTAPITEYPSAHLEMVGYMVKHYPNIAQRARMLTIREAYTFMAKHFEVEFKDEDEVHEICVRILTRAKTGMHGDVDG